MITKLLACGHQKILSYSHGEMINQGFRDCQGNRTSVPFTHQRRDVENWGGRRSVDASQSDLALLRQARFTVFVNSTNPAIKDRVLAVNKLICTDGTRRLKVNVARCPSLVEALEKQPYNQHGEPDKSAGLDHISDAAGYYLAYQYPIVQRITTVTQISIR